MNPNPILAFGEFRLDPQSGRLYRDSIPVPLTPKAFALLQYLASRAGNLIQKEELLSALWADVFVGDAVLKVAIREVRRALGDNSHAPRFVETAHRRGYRFIAPVTALAPALSGRDIGAPAAGVLPAAGVAGLVAPPRVSYARSGSVNIAYQVVGSGPIDLVFVMGWVSHLECFWTEPSFARFLTRLASVSRLILFDKRGTGLSDAVPIAELPTLEQRLDDVRAVMDAAGSEHAALLGISEGGPLCSLFAATYPDKTDALIMIGSYARRMRDDDYPWGRTAEERDRFCEMLIDQWGGPVGLEERAPSKVDDPAFREWWASFLRMGASPGAVVALTRMNAEIDIRALLPSIRVPALVLHRTGDRCLKVEEGRYLASRIPGAAFVELPGEDHLPFVGDQEAILAPIEAFLARAHVRPRVEQVLATVLTVAADTGAADALHLRHVFEREVAWYRGRIVSGDAPRLVGIFDGPGRAVRCACSVARIAERSRIRVRGGVHIGECDVATFGGQVAAVSAAIAATAQPGEIRVSRTVVDVVPGSGLQFQECGNIDVPATARDLPLYVVTGR